MNARLNADTIIDGEPSTQIDALLREFEAIVAPLRRVIAKLRQAFEADALRTLSHSSFWRRLLQQMYRIPSFDVKLYFHSVVLYFILHKKIILHTRMIMDRLLFEPDPRLISL